MAIEWIIYNGLDAKRREKVFTRETEENEARLKWIYCIHVYIYIIYSQIEHMYTRTGDKLRERETAVRDAK